MNKLIEQKSNIEYNNSLIDNFFYNGCNILEKIITNDNNKQENYVLKEDFMKLLIKEQNNQLNNEDETIINLYKFILLKFYQQLIKINLEEILFQKNILQYKIQIDLINKKKQICLNIIELFCYSNYNLEELIIILNNKILLLEQIDKKIKNRNIILNF